MEIERDELMFIHGLGEFVGQKGKLGMRKDYSGEDDKANLLTMQGLDRFSDYHNWDNDSDSDSDDDIFQLRQKHGEPLQKSSRKLLKQPIRKPLPKSMPVLRPTPERRSVLVAREENYVPALLQRTPSRNLSQRTSSKLKKSVVVHSRERRYTNMDSILAAIEAQAELERKEMEESSKGELDSILDDDFYDYDVQMSTADVVGYQRTFPTLKVIKSSMKLAEQEFQPEVDQETRASSETDLDSISEDYYRESVGKVSEVEFVRFQKGVPTLKIIQNARSLAGLQWSGEMTCHYRI
jgi:hypothetical protein